MSLFEAIFLGLVQGFAEFLPISSTGHLSLFQRLFHINEPTMTFDVLLHLGTLIPVVIVFWKDIWALVKNPFQKMTALLLVGTLPATVVALFFDEYVEAAFSSITFLGIGFIITGLVLLYADGVADGKKSDKNITFLDALLIGVAQGFAIAPAISRSGSTISASLACGLNREAAAKFSFLLSIPAISGAVLLELIKLFKNGMSLGNLNPVYMLAGFLSAMISGYFAIRFMLTLIKRAKLTYFAYYVFALAAIILVDQWVLGKILFG